jgi:hypothetical protein
VVRTHHDVGYAGQHLYVVTLFGLYLVREAGLRTGAVHRRIEILAKPTTPRFWPRNEDFDNINFV